MEHALYGSVRTDLQSHLCFVLMPFDPVFNEVWEDVVRPSAQEANLQPRRADEIMRPGVIVRDIWESILQARVLVADLTGSNANVFYELGLAHAVEKEVILLSQSIENLPFDQRHLRVIPYAPTEQGLQQLRVALRQAFETVLAATPRELAPSLRREAVVATRRQIHRDQVATPFLTFTFQAAYANGQPVDPRVELENVGDDLALNCLYCARVVWERPSVEVLPGVREQVMSDYRYPPASTFTSPFHVAVGKPVSGLVHEVKDFEYSVQAILTGLDYRIGLSEAVVCEDRAGTRYRFRSDRTQPDQWRPGDPIQGWETWIPLPPPSS